MSSVKGARMPDDDAPSDAAIEDQLRQARQALSDAEGARNADLSDAVVINRLYYACFHAAQAALYERGHDPTTHGGVLSLFGSEIVVVGDASREDGRFLNDLADSASKPTTAMGPSTRTSTLSLLEPATSSPQWNPSVRSPGNTRNPNSYRVTRLSERFRSQVESDRMRGACLSVAR